MMNRKWRIGDIAKAFHISADALRYYEKEGLLPTHKNQQNGYRYYQYDDIIQLMDVIFYRSLDLPVKDIHKIVTSMGIPEIHEIMEERESIVDQKLAGLLCLKQQLRANIMRYEQCSAQVGKFSIVPAPPICYKFLGLQEADILDVIYKYQSLHARWIGDLRYSIRIPQQNILRDCSFSTSELGIGVTRADDGEVWDAAFFQDFSLLPQGDYLYTIITTDYREQKNPILLEAKNWLQDRQRHIAGDLIGCFSVASHSAQMDYYEIWIPII